MGMSVTFKVDTRELERGITALGRKAPTAIARALNKTAASANSLAVKAVAANLGIVQKRVRPQIKVLRANPENLTSVIYAAKVAPGVTAFRTRADKLGRIPLYAFNARGPIPSRGKGGGVRYSLPTGRGVAPHAFIATVKAGKFGATHTGVFMRIPGTQMKSAPFSNRLGKQVKRQEIFELYGPSIPHVFVERTIMNAQVKAGAENLFKNLKHETEWLLSQQR